MFTYTQPSLKSCGQRASRMNLKRVSSESWLAGFFSCSIFVILLTGCAAYNPFGEETVQVEVVKTSGFLSDYEILRPGQAGEAALVYWNPDVDFSSYEAVLIEPVTIWLADDSPMKDVDPDERRKLANEFHAKIVEALQADYQITAEPGPKTMRIRVALTDAKSSAPVLDTISTYVPQARLLASAITLGSDTAGFVGQASAEAEVRDAETNLLLAAGVDRRAGTKAIGDGTLDAWEDVRRAFEIWTKQFAKNLSAQRDN